MTTQEFIFEAPLFCKVEGEESDAILEDLKNYDGFKVDGFNAQKGVESTYTISNVLNCRYNLENSYIISYEHSLFKLTEPWYVTLKCGRYEDKIDIMLIVDAEKHAIMKVGQYPTIADMHKAQIKQYKTVLSNEEMKEFTRAIGLAASGVGIGAFVYLRRIFENQIEKAFENAIKEGYLSENDFISKRMDEKIGMLKNYLPDALVEIRQIYGILSKGIHSLTEEECLLHFEVVKNGIEMILDEKLEQNKRAKKYQRTKESISLLKSKLESK
ncbi:MAG: hypothetical protein J6R26_00695 [Paludibacteraceae bacterium]|nr:hypothetical protein [Paludibacteraceae bacterium]